MKFNIHSHLQKRPLSWSALASFEWNPEDWYRSYVLGEKQFSREMEFGSYVDKRIQTDSKFLPDLPRYALMQHKMKTSFGKIPLVGIPDGLDFDVLHLADFKTGKKAWDQKRADETGQLTFYLLLLWLTNNVKPEQFKCYIHWLPTKENGDFSITLIEPVKIHTFETKRTMRDLLDFGKRINSTVKLMNAYANNHA